MAAIGNVERQQQGGEVIMEDMACCGHVGVVAEPPVHEVAVDVWA